VAVAAGSYAEDVRIDGKAVQLWGRCPGMVEIAGASEAAVQVWYSTADETEIRGIAVTGPQVGILVSDARSVVIEQVWLHDTGFAGIQIQNTNGSTSAVLKGSLIERTHAFGAAVLGSEVTIDATVVRATQGSAQQGFGISIQNTNERANVTVHASLIEQNEGVGVIIHGSDVAIEATAVRNTVWLDDERGGDGIAVRTGNVTIQNAEVVDNARAGVSNFGGQVTITGGVFICNKFALDYEILDGVTGSFDGSTGWQCSIPGSPDCTVVDECKAVTSSLEPPPTLEPL
jgi:Right handed beta helix region